MSATREIGRRTVLRGMLRGGAAVTVGLPVLESFLNANGTAYAATGAPLPPCFGTWFWGLGLIPNHWEPAIAGPDYELPEHLAGLKPIRSKMNLFSGMQVFLDGKVNQNHYSGAQGQMPPAWCRAMAATTRRASTPSSATTSAGARGSVRSR